MQVLLEIVGTQRIDEMKDKIELTTVGFLEESENEYTVKYSEEQEGNTPAVDVCVVISKEKPLVTMTRSGAFDSRLVIEGSKRNLCHYGSEYGDILMGISGHSISAEFDGRKGEFVFFYDIDINGALASRNSLTMGVKRCQN
ncbi:MAG: DUF1934 domain-containing protein [Eubacterium sp.]|nr:DUF1934 domain-containing protein [Eubacterium sp.]